MTDALKLFADLGITHVPIAKSRARGPMVTTCLAIVERMINSHGPGHATLVLRTVVESEGNEGALIADIIMAISELVLAHPRWANLGLVWLGAFDKIDLLEVRATAKAANVQPLRVGIATLVGQVGRDVGSESTAEAG